MKFKKTFREKVDKNESAYCVVILRENGLDTFKWDTYRYGTIRAAMQAKEDIQRYIDTLPFGYWMRGKAYILHYYNETTRTIQYEGANDNVTFLPSGRLSINRNRRYQGLNWYKNTFSPFPITRTDKLESFFYKLSNKSKSFSNQC